MICKAKLQIFTFILFFNLVQSKNYLKSTYISTTSWNTFTQLSKQNVAKSVLECGSLCTRYNQEDKCNAFSFISTDHTCVFAKLTKLEDEQEGVTSQVNQ